VAGVITIADADSATPQGSFGDVIIDEENSELDLINRLTDIVREQDPDILAGYEVQSSSWGYVIERARIQYGKFHPS